MNHNKQYVRFAFGVLALSVLIAAYAHLTAPKTANNQHADHSTNSQTAGDNSNSNNKTMDNSTSDSEGLKKEILTPGTGDREVKAGDTITVNYRGTFVDGKQFDSSYDRAQPFTTQIGTGQVIKGWDEGMLGMKVGEKRKLTVPAALGYGEQGVGPIPGGATLIFEVELLSIQ